MVENILRNFNLLRCIRPVHLEHFLAGANLNVEQRLLGEHGLTLDSALLALAFGDLAAFRTLQQRIALPVPEVLSVSGLKAAHDCGVRFNERRAHHVRDRLPDRVVLLPDCEFYRVRLVRDDPLNHVGRDAELLGLFLNPVVVLVAFARRVVGVSLPKQRPQPRGDDYLRGLG